jgi:rod shape determining protein RodA
VAGNPLYYVTRQAIYAGVGLALMFLLARFDYSRLRELKLGIYAGMLSLILLVLVVGGATRGSRRWIELPFFTFQPSEFGKVLLIIALAAFIVDRSRKLSARETTSRIMLLALLPAGMVIIQPDLGTGMVYIAIVMALLFVAGTSWKHLAGLVGIGLTAIVLTLVALPAIGVNVLKPYQVDRLTSFLHPTDNPQEQGYQVNQSLTAIGAGQKTGRGAEDATQTKLDFLPEHHTDFVFSVVGEEFGFMGAAIVLSLYSLLIWRSLRILTMAKNLYGALIAGGVVAMLMFQVFVNVGMTIGIMPVTGVTLPLMSYGGASVITTFLALGLLQSIHVQSHMLAAAKGREVLA